MERAAPGLPRPLSLTWRKRICLKRLSHCLTPGRPVRVNTKPNPNLNLTIALDQSPFFLLSQEVLFVVPGDSHIASAEPCVHGLSWGGYVRGSCLLHIAYKTVMGTLVCAPPTALLCMDDPLFPWPRTLLSAIPTSRKWDPGQDGWLGQGAGRK